MSDALFAVQDALFDRLAAAAVVQAQLGNPPRLYDHVPPDASYPFAIIGDVQAETFDDKNGFGFDQTVTLQVWSRYRGRKQVKDILHAIYQTLHYADLTISGQTLAFCRLDSVDVRLEDDGLTYRALARYRIAARAAS